VALCAYYLDLCCGRHIHRGVDDNTALVAILGGKHMEYIESPAIWGGGKPSVFLAGGITGCPDWQQEVARSNLAHDDIALINPRRANFPIHDPGAALAQITWEHEHLRKATAILFWFPRETICPIVLYELGAWSMTDKPLFVGVHPDYSRRRDVEIQTALVRPDVKLVYSLGELVDQVWEWALPGERDRLVFIP